NLDTPDAKDKVRLMTVHAAKGLEFPHVFICGLNEGIFPSRKVRTIQAMEEERRLAFVALTRAMDGLYLTESEGKNHDGTFRYPSRFVLDIDAHLLDFREPLPESLVREARDHIAVNDALLTEEDAEQKYLSPGERVKHPVFGPGTVEEVDLEKSAYVVKFDGLPTTRAITFRVRLEKL
ncbi:MAG: ATP-binding domain-containing protein, partial [Lachnospiraceae bacterium]|nr:ATP-binding domain-containing protein [Lachnospiraceae bacterium]